MEETNTQLANLEKKMKAPMYEAKVPEKVKQSNSERVLLHYTLFLVTMMADLLLPFQCAKMRQEIDAIKQAIEKFKSMRS